MRTPRTRSCATLHHVPLRSYPRGLVKSEHAVAG